LIVGRLVRDMLRTTVMGMDDLHGTSSLEFTALEGFYMIEILCLLCGFVACLLDGTERSREDERF
jgi:hypothetical protein